jgi:transcriptional regulator with XRE-family HTH domain
MKRHNRGKIITQYREARDLTAWELGRQFGQGRSGSLNQFEIGARPLSNRLLVRVAKQLQIPWRKLASPEQLELWKAIRGAK